MRQRGRWICASCRRLFLVVLGEDPRCDRCEGPTAAIPAPLVQIDRMTPPGGWTLTAHVLGEASEERHVALAALKGAIGHQEKPSNDGGDPWTMTTLYSCVALINGAPPADIRRECDQAMAHYTAQVAHLERQAALGHLTLPKGTILQ